jgi:hypothetical protein
MYIQDAGEAYVGVSEMGRRARMTTQNVTGAGGPVKSGCPARPLPCASLAVWWAMRASVSALRLVSLIMSAPVVAGCGNGSGSSPVPGDSSAWPHVVASGPAASAAPSSAPRLSTPPPAAPGATAACSFERGLTGAIGPASVFVQLHRAGDELTGTYFYEKVGAEISLQGRITGASVALVESLAGKSTGKLEGECQAGGALTGTWSSPDGSRKLPFSLSVPAKITVGTRRLAFTARSKDRDGLGDCTFNRVTPVVFGAASAAVERRMAETIAAAARAISDPQDERDARACHATGDRGRLAYFDGGFTTPSQDAKVLVFLFSAGVNTVPSAHPENYMGATVLNLDVATGEAVTAAEVITDTKRLVEIAQKCSDGEVPPAGGDPDYLFLPRGIQVVGTSYPHALAVFTFQGPVISYASLLRDGLLKEGSPIARVWSGVKPAAAGDSPCLVRWKPE